MLNNKVSSRFFGAGKLLFDPAAYVRKVVHLLLFSGEQIHWYLFGRPGGTKCFSWDISWKCCAVGVCLALVVVRP